MSGVGDYLRRISSPEVPPEKVLIIGDYFFGSRSLDWEMVQGVPGAMVLAVGGLADPMIDNIFVWPTQGHEASMEITSVLARN